MMVVQIDSGKVRNQIEEIRRLFGTARPILFAAADKRAATPGRHWRW